MRITVGDEYSLEEAGITEITKINLQDQSRVSKKSKLTNSYFMVEEELNPQTSFIMS